MNDLIAFGRRLAELRKAKGLSQEEFSSLADKNKNSQGDYEKGKTAPTVEYLYRLSEHGIDIGYVLTGIRSDRPLDDESSQLVDRLARLSDRERRGIARLVDTLLGNDPAPGSIYSMVDRDQVDAARGVLHDQKSDYRSKD